MRCSIRTAAENEGMQANGRLKAELSVLASARPLARRSSSWEVYSKEAEKAKLALWELFFHRAVWYACAAGPLRPTSRLAG